MGMLDDKVAVVTGASSGLGRAIALRYAAEGACVALADLREEPVEGGATTLALIEAAGGRAFFVDTDVGEWSHIDRLIDATVQRFGRLDVMVNNAATYTSTNLLESTEAQWERVLRVNLTGMFFGCKRAVQQMVTQEPIDEVRGRIVNISSQHGMVASPGDAPYGVSKGGTVQLTRQVAVDHAPDLIVCNAVAPGKIITGKPGAANDPQALDYSRRRTPWPRLGRPEDVAGAALFLGSSLASFVTGINLMVDGGWMAG
ncbi:MAG TPA: SDR family oxidoreductase [Paraburkholderia sp.]|mgnify:CR=1 FL=1|jgi:glucose 1-dehydrogenase|nr:SDR family oxidoreductase [Paraburkholderia sp.]